MDKRVVELEFKLAYLEAAHETLNDVVTMQQQQITHLQERLAIFEQHIKSLAPSDINPGHEKPPHY